MALLFYLVAVVLLFAGMRLVSGRRLRMRRHVFADTEKGVAMTSCTTKNGEAKPSRKGTPPQPVPRLPAKSLCHYDDDSKAANDQLLSEFAASTALDSYCSRSHDSAHPDATNDIAAEVSEKQSSPLSPEEQPILVNPKQFHRILKRRAARQALEDSLRLMAKRMEKGRELRSMRGFDGVVVGAVS